MSERLSRYVVRVVAVIAAAIAFHRYAVLPWRADHVLSTVEKRTAFAAKATGTTAVLAARSNVEMLETVAAVCRTDANYYMLYAFNQRILGNASEAVATYSEALQFADHRPEIYFGRGQANLELGKVDEAAADLIHAARFNPGILDEISGDLKTRVANGANIH